MILDQDEAPDKLHEERQSSLVKKIKILLERESSSYIELSSQLEGMTDALSTFHPLLNKSPEALMMSSHLLALFFSSAAFLRSLSKLIAGGPFQLTRGIVFGYAAVIFGLLLTAWIVPTLGVIMGLGVAVMGFGASALYLGQYLKKRVTLYIEQRKLDKSLARLRADHDADVTEVAALMHQALDADALVAQLDRLDQRIKARSDWFPPLAAAKKKSLESTYRLKSVALFRAFSMFTASIALAGAILVFFMPYIGGMLLMTSFVVSCTGILYKFGEYLVHQYHQRHTRLKSQASVEESKLDQVEVPDQAAKLENKALHELDEHLPHVSEVPPAAATPSTPLPFEPHLGHSPQKGSEKDVEEKTPDSH